MKKNLIILANVLIVVGIIAFVYVHINRQNRLTVAAQTEAFQSMTVAMERVTTNYLVGEQRVCDSWANYINSADLTLADLANANFYLGHSQFKNHADANARYDEVRIWNGVLPQSAMEMSAVLGPDATASQLAGIGQNSANGVTALAVAQGATLDMTGVSLASAVVSGGGKVAGGALTAIGELRAKLGECLVIDGGTFNIDGVKVVFDAEDLDTLAASPGKTYVLVKTVNGGTIVGSPLQPATDAALPAGKHWHVVATSGAVTLFKGGMTLFLR